MRRILVALAALAFARAGAAARAAPASVAQSDAFARAAGNRRVEAVRLGEALFATQWPAQILKVRIDAAGSHEVAGLVLSGVKFHRPLDAQAFTQEVVALVSTTFAASEVEEVDVWATIPIAVGRHEIVAGDMAQPTSRIVYGATIERSEAATYAARLGRGDDVFWNAAWKASLGARS